jgi:hypothetical protein
LLSWKPPEITPLIVPVVPVLLPTPASEFRKTLPVTMEPPSRRIAPNGCPTAVSAQPLPVMLNA